MDFVVLLDFQTILANRLLNGFAWNPRQNFEILWWFRKFFFFFDFLFFLHFWPSTTPKRRGWFWVGPKNPENHGFMILTPTFGCTTRPKMVKNQKIQKILKSSQNFRNFGGGFMRIRSLATEHGLLKVCSKSTKIVIFARNRDDRKSQVDILGRKIESGMVLNKPSVSNICFKWFGPSEKEFNYR